MVLVGLVVGPGLCLCSEVAGPLVVSDGIQRLVIAPNGIVDALGSVVGADALTNEYFFE